MTKKQIQDLIAKKIAGQGTAIDAGSVFPAVLNAILDKATPLESDDIENLTDEQLENMSAGDVVIKKDATGEHAYVCSYKGEGGLCLTYADCENVETLAYEKDESGWAFDDKTVTHIGA